MLLGAVRDDDAETGDVGRLRTLLAFARSERDEAHHRVANSLQQAISTLRAQRRDLRSDEARFALLTAEAQLEGIARIHHLLSRHDAGGDIALDDFFAALSKDLRAAFGVDLMLDCEAVTVPGEIAAQLAVVLNELVLNAVKHAGAGRGGSAVRVELRNRRDGLRLTVSDQGPGFPEGGGPDAPSGGLGMTIVTGAVDRIGGSVAVHSAGGAVVVVDVPLS